MDPAIQVVTRLPLQELWGADGFKTTTRIRSLTEEDISELLRCGFIQFVVIDIGTTPSWIPPSECFEFWKREAKPHLVKNSRAILDEFPGDYCYFASQWDSTQAAPIVVLEKWH